jgi:hypothetical protein
MANNIQRAGSSFVGSGVPSSGAARPAPAGNSSAPGTGLRAPHSRVVRPPDSLPALRPAPGQGDRPRSPWTPAAGSFAPSTPEGRPVAGHGPWCMPRRPHGAALHPHSAGRAQHGAVPPLLPGGAPPRAAPHGPRRSRRPGRRETPIRQAMPECPAGRLRASGAMPRIRQGGLRRPVLHPTQPGSSSGETGRRITHHATPISLSPCRHIS